MGGDRKGRGKGHHEPPKPAPVPVVLKRGLSGDAPAPSFVPLTLGQKAEPAAAPREPKRWGEDAATDGTPPAGDDSARQGGPDSEPASGDRAAEQDTELEAPPEVRDVLALLGEPRVFEEDLAGLTALHLDVGRLLGLSFKDHFLEVPEALVTQEQVDRFTAHAEWAPPAGSESLGSHGRFAFAADSPAPMHSLVWSASSQLTVLLWRDERPFFQESEELLNATGAVLVFGRAGAGKTCALRELARAQAAAYGAQVCVLDDGDLLGPVDPAAGLGAARQFRGAAGANLPQVLRHRPRCVVCELEETDVAACVAALRKGVQVIFSVPCAKLEDLGPFTPLLAFASLAVEAGAGGPPVVYELADGEPKDSYDLPLADDWRELSPMPRSRKQVFVVDFAGYVWSNGDGACSAKVSPLHPCSTVRGGARWKGHEVGIWSDYFDRSSEGQMWLGALLLGLLACRDLDARGLILRGEADMSQDAFDAVHRSVTCEDRTRDQDFRGATSAERSKLRRLKDRLMELLEEFNARGGVVLRLEKSRQYRCELRRVPGNGGKLLGDLRSLLEGEEPGKEEKPPKPDEPYVPQAVKDGRWDPGQRPVADPNAPRPSQDVRVSGPDNTRDYRPASRGDDRGGRNRDDRRGRDRRR